MAGGYYWISGSYSREAKSEIPSFSFSVLRVGREGLMRYAVGRLDWNNKGPRWGVKNAPLLLPFLSSVKQGNLLKGKDV